MAKYRKKPVVINAIQFTRDNSEDVIDFIEDTQLGIGLDTEGEVSELIIPTLEGNMKANINDYIIKGVQGEFYPCKPDIFEETYEKV